MYSIWYDKMWKLFIINTSSFIAQVSCAMQLEQCHNVFSCVLYNEEKDFSD